MFSQRPLFSIGFAVGLLFASPLSIDSRLSADDAAQADRTQVFLPAVTISGDAHERGLAYGTLFRDRIHEFLHKEIFTPFAGKPSSKEELLAYAAACGDVVREECPLVAREIEGIAEGAGLTFEDIILIQSHEELYHRVPLPDKHGHCTAVAIAPPDTGSEHTYVGQTWDWMQSVEGLSDVTEWQREEGTSVLAYGYPGMPMGAGMNSHGIALCWTSAALGTKGQSPRVGIPSYTLISHLLNQPDIESVMHEAKKNKHSGWFTFVMADGEGNLLNIEGSPSGVAIARSSDRLARVGYGTPEMTGVKTGETVPLHSRCQHMYDLLESTSGTNSLGRLQDYFADADHKILAGQSTIDIMVFDTLSRRAYMTRGPAYYLEWREFTFSEGK